MKTIKMDPDFPDKDLINEAVNILMDNGVIIYPTDTVYGLGANIFSEEAVKKIYSLKKRDENKPLSVCVSSIGELSLIAEIRLEHRDFITKRFPGPFTFVFYKKSPIPQHFPLTNKKIGVRIPKNLISIELSQNFPITSTSANLSGERTLKTPKEIAKQLNGKIDLAIDVGPLSSPVPSTVVDLTKKEINILRHGAGNI